MDNWESWRELPAEQQPDWPDQARLGRVAEALRTRPPLVTAGDCELLRAELAEVAQGRAFVLQGGDCAETFARVSAEAVARQLTTLLQMAVILTYGAAVPVVKIGRLAGQYAKPRSNPTETRGGTTLPAYRGDAVNGAEFAAAARTSDPARLLSAYEASAATLRHIRDFGSAIQPDLQRVHSWNQDFVRQSPAGVRHARAVGEIDLALRFMRACRARTQAAGPDFYTSHEALILPYESALTRRDPRTGAVFGGSGHMLWIGERTRRLDGAHVAFASRIANPIGVKIGPEVRPQDVLGLIDALDPHRRLGRLTFIVRMGAQRIRDRLPDLVAAVAASGAEVVWLCDPMHGNTLTAPSGHKTRRFDDVLAELTGFVEVHAALGTHPGGVHIELTGDDVTECLGGGDPVGPDDLHRRYDTACDPRLNRSQSLDLAFRVAAVLRETDPLRPAACA